MSARRGALIVEGTRVDVSQEPAPCRFELDTTRIDVAAEAGRAQVRVATQGGCSWTAQSNESWIVITAGRAATASDVVELSIGSNPGGARQGTVRIAGQTVLVAQAARAVLAPAPNPTPTPAPPPTPTPAPNPTPTPAPPPPTPAPAPKPDPGPSPKPDPGPPPTPPPPPVLAIEVDGRVESVSGNCPLLTVKVGGRVVVTDEATDYRKGNCKHVQANAQLLVIAVQVGGGLKATRIDIVKRADELAPDVPD